MTLIEYVRAAEKLGLPRRSLVSLLALSVATTFAESIGLALVVPIYDFISIGGDLARLPDSRYWQGLFAVAHFFGLEIGLAFLLLLAFVAVLLRQAGSYARQISVARSRELVNKRVRDGVFRGYINASLGAQEGLKGGELVNVLTNELGRFNSSHAGFVVSANAMVMAIVYGIFLAWTSWQMTLASLVVVLISISPLRRIYLRTVEAGKAATKANLSSTEFFVERLAPARLIRLSRSESAEIARMEGFTSAQQRTVLNLERMMALTAVMIEPLILGLVFSLIYVAIAILKVPMASLAIFLLVIVRLLPVAKDVMKGRQLILACAGSTLALLSMLDRLKSAAEGKGGPVELPGMNHSLRFLSTSFHYPSADRSALDGVNLTIPAGSLVAIVGPSGAGKSTLIDLLPALRRPTSGAIEIDGQHIEDLSLASLRSSIAYVPQHAQIYDIAIAEHIRLGRRDATEADIAEALSLAGAEAFVAQLPQGMHARLGQAGTSLSGGQRQRIDLARAIVSRASMLILDEPTSALDAESEKAFIATLKHLRAERHMTILVVTHRLALVRNADQIVVMRDGRVEASGILEEVRAQSAWFAEALSTQFDERGHGTQEQTP